MKYLSNSEQETLNIARALGETLKAGDIVALYGDLGSGKTVFVRGICESLGITDVHSPTFTLVNEYDGQLPVFHFDVYRLENDDWDLLGFDEYLYAKGISLVEWSERVHLPPCIKVSINGNGDQPREIDIDISSQ